jgi:LPS sulfotransferase NodH
MKAPITVVTGIPRSGTSLMMQLLEKAGLSIHADHQRKGDNNNPQGYYELEAVKGIVKNNSFLQDASGKAVKIVAPLPIYIDLSLEYRFIFMIRDLYEVLQSQEIMVQKNQEAEREKFKKIYQGHIEKTKAFLTINSIPFIVIDYNNLMNQPTVELTKLIEFLSLPNKLDDLLPSINRALYRNKNEN